MNRNCVSHAWMAAIFSMAFVPSYLLTAADAPVVFRFEQYRLTPTPSKLDQVRGVHPRLYLDAV